MVARRSSLCLPCHHGPPEAVAVSCLRLWSTMRLTRRYSGHRPRLRYESGEQVGSCQEHSPCRRSGPITTPPTVSRELRRRGIARRWAADPW
jgi:hypothetical protein